MEVRVHGVVIRASPKPWPNSIVFFFIHGESSALCWFASFGSSKVETRVSICGRADLSRQRRIASCTVKYHNKTIAQTSTVPPSEVGSMSAPRRRRCVGHSLIGRQRHQTIEHAPMSMSFSRSLVDGPFRGCASSLPQPRRRRRASSSSTRLTPSARLDSSVTARLSR